MLPRGNTTHTSEFESDITPRNIHPISGCIRKRDKLVGVGT